MKRITLIILLTAAFGISTSNAQTGDVSNYGTFKNSRDAEKYDSLIMQLHERNSAESYERFYNEFINIDPSTVDMSDALSDAEYERRLKLMATEIQLPYNHIVKSYIVLYTKKSRMETLLGRAQYYMPMIEDALYRYGLPMELKMLPIIESALIPKAVSSASAAGIWQFMSGTAKPYGLEINSFVDERCDPVKSTDAACRHLRDLYNRYHDWTLVIAAYNCGSGTVNKALARVPNATNYWEIYEHLPRETRSYLPAFIGASYAYTYHKAHNMKPAPIAHPLAVDTIMIDRMLHFEQISSTLNIPIEILRDLNPQYRLDIIPALANKYSLTLPQSEVSRFIKNENDIYAKDSLYLTKYLNVTNLSDAAKVTENRKLTSNSSKGQSSGTKTTYKIKSGDNLSAIAKKHGVKVSDIQKWNGLKGTNISAGKNLTIYKN